MDSMGKGEKSMEKADKHGVRIQYGEASVLLTANQVRFIADALAFIDPVALSQKKTARELHKTFDALADYAEWVDNHVYT